MILSMPKSNGEIYMDRFIKFISIYKKLILTTGIWIMENNIIIGRGYKN